MRFEHSEISLEQALKEISQSAEKKIENEGTVNRRRLEENLNLAFSSAD